VKPTWYHTENEYIRLLHLPYTIWHLSYVLLGAAMAPTVFLDRTLFTLTAFFLAMGIGAHYMDEMNGRPLQTTIKDEELMAISIISVLVACILGIIGMILVTALLLPFILFGGFIVAAYSLEWFDGKLHTDNWFAVSWGAFPMITAFFINAETITISALAMAFGCWALSRAQRVLSTRVREVRRKIHAVQLAITYHDSTGRILGKEYLMKPSEEALKFLTVTITTMSIALFIWRLV